MYLVSSCLAGIPCRYDGKCSENKEIINLVRQGKAIPVCPEEMAGLPTPRVRCEIVTDEKEGNKVISLKGQDVTKEFVEGAQKALRVAQQAGASKAILKSKSPSCGCGLIYDGTFSGNLIEGNGFTAEILLQHGIEVYNEKNFVQIDQSEN